MAKTDGNVNEEGGGIILIYGREATQLPQLPGLWGPVDSYINGGGHSDFRCDKINDDA